MCERLSRRRSTNVLTYRDIAMVTVITTAAVITPAIEIEILPNLSSRFR
jgi:hypothetical protein